jgi:hypothetical protein
MQRLAHKVALSRFPCKLARPSRVKMLNLLRYLTFGLGVA